MPDYYFAKSCKLFPKRTLPDFFPGILLKVTAINLDHAVQTLDLDLATAGHPGNVGRFGLIRHTAGSAVILTLQPSGIWRMPGNFPTGHPVMEIMMSAVRNASTRSTSEVAAAENALLARPAKIFQGYNSVDGGGRSTAVQGTTEDVGATSSVYYRVCEDTETLSRALNINQSLAIGFGPFGSFDEKMNFFLNLKTTTYSISIVIYAHHSVGAQTMTDVSLKETITPPEDDAALNEFFRIYGDSFVSSITRGGEYYATYTFYSQTREEQTELEVSMKAHGVFEGGNMDADLQTKLSNFVKTTNVRVEFNQKVSGLRNPKPPKPENIIDYALAFPSLEPDAPDIIAFKTSGYENVRGVTRKFRPIAENRRYFTGDDIYSGITPDLVEVQRLRDHIRSLTDTYKFYGGFTDDKVKEVGGLAQTDLKTIHGQMNAYNDDPTQTFEQPTLKSLEPGIPKLNCRIDTSPPFGKRWRQPIRRRRHRLSQELLAA